MLKLRCKVLVNDQFINMYGVGLHLSHFTVWVILQNKELFFTKIQHFFNLETILLVFQFGLNSIRISNCKDILFSLKACEE